MSIKFPSCMKFRIKKNELKMLRLIAINFIKHYNLGIFSSSMNESEG